MKAMILAAGRGERMRPLTDVLPKPMLEVAGKPLLEHHISKLVAAGITEIVINLAWLGEKIEQYFQQGEKFGAHITYSWERSGALETAGGIIKALPLLSADNEAFLVVNGDIYCDFDFSALPLLADQTQAHFWLVDNPEHHPQGDFLLEGHSLANLDDAKSKASQSYTFSGIGMYKPSFFAEHLNQQVQALAPLMRKAIAQHQVTGQKLPGLWTDVGTPERLAQLNENVR